MIDEAATAARLHGQYHIEMVCRRFAAIKAHARASTSFPAIDRALPPPERWRIALHSAIGLGLMGTASAVLSQDRGRVAAGSNA